MRATGLKNKLACIARPGIALARDRAGGAAMEFALCSTAFVALLVAALQIALVYFGQQNIQTSTEIMARKVMTGQISSDTTTQAQFLANACTTLPAYMDCNKLYVDIRQASTFPALDTAMPTPTFDSNGNITGGLTYQSGTAGSAVILRLFYRWSITSGPLGFNLDNASGGRRLLIGTMVFKSEPYRV